MNRRAFIALLGAAAWPVTAHAQQPSKLRVIGFLGTTTPAAWSQWTAAFVQRLRELGWIEGRTITIEYRWAEGHPERYAEIATEFVRLPVDIIVGDPGSDGLPSLVEIEKQALLSSSSRILPLNDSMCNVLHRFAGCDVVPRDPMLFATGLPVNRP